MFLESKVLNRFKESQAPDGDPLTTPNSVWDLCCWRFSLLRTKELDRGRRDT